MLSEAERNEWLQDDATKLQLARLQTEIKAATKDLLVSFTAKGIDEIRERAGYRRGLHKAWTLLAGKAKDDGEETET